MGRGTGTTAEIFLYTVPDEAPIEPSVRIGQLFTIDSTDNWRIIFNPGETIKIKGGILIKSPPRELFKLTLNYFFIDADENKTWLGKRVYRDRGPGACRTSKQVELPAEAASGTGKLRCVVTIRQDGVLIHKTVRRGFIDIEAAQ